MIVNPSVCSPAARDLWRITAERVDGFQQILRDMLTVNATLVAQRQNEEMRALTEASNAQNIEVKKISAWAAILFAPTLVGTVFAHRAFDFVPAAVLVVWVLASAQLPHWAVTSLVIFGVVGSVLLTVGLVSAGTGQGRVHLDKVTSQATGSAGGARSTRSSSKPSGASLPFHDASAAKTTRCRATHFLT